jgi:hypothetical protein
MWEFIKSLPKKLLSSLTIDAIKYCVSVMGIFSGIISIIKITPLEYIYAITTWGITLLLFLYMSKIDKKISKLDSFFAKKDQDNIEGKLKITDDEIYIVEDKDVK